MSPGVHRAFAFAEDLLRLNAVCPYYTMFPLDFPFEQMASHGSTTRVLDPFCGTGSTLIACAHFGAAWLGLAYPSHEPEPGPLRCDLVRVSEP